MSVYYSSLGKEKKILLFGTILLPLISVCIVFSRFLDIIQVEISGNKN